MSRFVTMTKEEKAAARRRRERWDREIAPWIMERLSWAWKVERDLRGDLLIYAHESGITFEQMKDVSLLLETSAIDARAEVTGYDSDPGAQPLIAVRDGMALSEVAYDRRSKSA